MIEEIKFHTDSALILQHDESRHIGLMQDDIQVAIDSDDYDKAEGKRFLLTEYLLRVTRRAVAQIDPFLGQSDVPFSLRECAI